MRTHRGGRQLSSGKKFWPAGSPHGPLDSRDDRLRIIPLHKVATVMNERLRRRRGQSKEPRLQVVPATLEILSIGRRNEWLGQERARSDHVDREIAQRFDGTPL